MYSPDSTLQLIYATISFVASISMLIGGIVFLVVAWRTMRAHEGIAQSTRFLLDEIGRRNSLSISKQGPPRPGM